MPISLSALLCRTSDYDRSTTEGAKALVEALSVAWNVPATTLGEPADGHRGQWEDDLSEAGACLRRAAQRASLDLEVPDAVPVLCLGHCTPCLATLPAIVEERPHCAILWIDAHPDYNSPQTTPSGFLGGMCLAAACGVWDSGFGGDVDPGDVFVSGARDIDPGEQRLLEETGVQLVTPEATAAAVAGRDVFIHLDLDVLDPQVLPGFAFPVPGGLDLAQLRGLLGEVSAAAHVVGIEITDCPGADAALPVAEALAGGLVLA